MGDLPLTPSLRMCPATLRRKVITAACIRTLDLRVVNQTSYIGIRYKNKGVNFDKPINLRLGFLLTQ